MMWYHDPAARSAFESAHACLGRLERAGFAAQTVLAVQAEKLGALWERAGQSPYYRRLQAVAARNLTALPVTCLLYTSPSPRDRTRSRMPSSA